MLLELAERYPDYSRIYLSLGFDQEHFHDEIFWYNKALNLFPNSDEVNALIGQCYLNAKKNDLSSEFIEKSLSLKHNNGLSLRILHNKCLQEDKKEEAKQLLIRAHMDNPTDSFTLKKLARIDEDNKDHALAIQHSKKYLELQNSAEIRDIMANSYKKLG